MARKRKYEGPSLEQVGPTTYRFEISVAGKRHKIYFDAASQQEAESIAPEKKKTEVGKLKKAHASGSTTLTIHTALGIFLSEKYPEAINPTGYQTHRGYIDGLKRFIAPTDLLIDFQQQELSKLVSARQRDTVTRIDENGNRVKKPVTPATVNRTTTELMSRVFTHFEDSRDYHFPDKPKFKRLSEPGERERFLHDYEYADVVKDIRSDYRVVFDFAMLTGLRQANCLIRWSEVTMAPDLSHGTVTVEIKSEGAQKEVVEFDLSVAACEIVNRQRYDDGTPFNNEWVFTYVAQKNHHGLIRGQRYPITKHGLKSWWRTHRRKSGLKNFRWHDTRHTAGTELQEHGGIRATQRQMGHKDMKTTQRYAHGKRGTLRRALNNMAEATPWGQHYLTTDKNTRPFNTGVSFQFPFGVVAANDDSAEIVSGEINK